MGWGWCGSRWVWVQGGEHRGSTEWWGSGGGGHLGVGGGPEGGGTEGWLGSMGQGSRADRGPQGGVVGVLGVGDLGGGRVGWIQGWLGSMGGCLWVAGILRVGLGVQGWWGWGSEMVGIRGW